MVEDRVAVFEVGGQQKAKTYPASPLELFAEELARTYGLSLGNAHYGKEPSIAHGLFRKAERDADGRKVVLSYHREPVADSKAIGIEQAVGAMTQGPKNESLALILDDRRNPEVIRIEYYHEGGVVSIMSLRAQIAYVNAKFDTPGKKPVFAFNLPFGLDQLDKAIAFTRNYVNLNR